MNEEKEIKEILNYLKNDDYSPVFANEGCDDTPYKLFDETEVKLLLNYITNLQEENQKLNKIIDELEKYIKENSIYYNTSDGCQWVDQFKLLDKLTELKKEVE